MHCPSICNDCRFPLLRISLSETSIIQVPQSIITDQNSPSLTIRVCIIKRFSIDLIHDFHTYLNSDIHLIILKSNKHCQHCACDTSQFKEFGASILWLHIDASCGFGSILQQHRCGLPNYNTCCLAWREQSRLRVQ